jgi:hypothetical protein
MQLVIPQWLHSFGEEIVSMAGVTETARVSKAVFIVNRGPQRQRKPG